MMRRSNLRTLSALGAGIVAATVVAGLAVAQDAPMSLPVPQAAKPAPTKPTTAAATPAKPTTAAAKPIVAGAAKPATAKPGAAGAAKPAATKTAAAKPAAAPKVPKPDAAVAKAALLAKMTGQVTPPEHHHVFETPKPTTCPGNPDAIGVSKIMKVDSTGGFYVGQTYHTKLPLEPMDVVLTFDDGPMAGRTDRVLQALDHECTKATFFIVGQMAKAYPETLRKTAAAGHTIGYHTMTHPLSMVKWPLDKAQANIRDGWQTVDQILYGQAGDKPATPFFRYPGLFNSRAINEWFNGMNMGVYAIDAAGNDWLKGYITMADGPNVMNRALSELEQQKGGILLLHDIKDSSSSIVAPLLRELKARGFHIVQLVPKTASPKLATGPVKGIVPTVAETTVPVGERGIDGYDAAKQMAQGAAGKTGKTDPRPLPAYDAGKPVQKAQLLEEVPTDPQPTGSIAAHTPRPEDGWFSSTAQAFRGAAVAIGLW
jgi:peptidoglycan/xylan/chitin deacetylase (PgdA/CDA1 family)